MKKTTNLILNYLIFCLIMGANIVSPITVRASNSNEQSYIGNSIGNIKNGGNAAYYDGWFYYSDPKDYEAKTYKMKIDKTNKVLLTNDHAMYINVVRDWVYYSNRGNDDYGCIYKVKTDGTGRQKLNDDESKELIVIGDWIYYQTNGETCRMMIDGSNKEILLNERVNILSIENGEIYYNIYNDDNVYKLNINSKQNEKVIVINGIGSSGFSIKQGEWVYYTKRTEPKVFYQGVAACLHRADINGNVNQEITNDAMGVINIWGNWIYYENIDVFSSAYKIKIDGTEKTKLHNDRFPQIFVFNNCAFISTYGTDDYPKIDILTGKSFQNETNEQPISVILNGKPIEFDQPPIVKNDTTIVPMRKVFETLGAMVIWDDETKTAIGIKDTSYVKTQIDNKEVTIYNNLKNKNVYLENKIQVKVAPAIIQNATYVPLRVIAEAFGATINWNGDENRVDIITQNDTQYSFAKVKGFYRDYNIPFTYNDSIFAKSASIYNPKLAELSAIGMMAAYNSKNKVKNKLGQQGYFNNVNNYLETIGFEILYNSGNYNYGKNEYEKEVEELGFASGREGVGFTIARKEINVNSKSQSVIAVFCRGTTGGEWYTNFDLSQWMGENIQDTHYGFNESAKEIKEALKTLSLGSNNKFWITGHSRGAAVANILAGDLSKEGKYAKSNDIYAYTFATPNVSIKANLKLANVFNYANNEDFVTKVPLSKWNYKKNGKTFDLNVNSEQFNKLFLAMTNKKFDLFSKNEVSNAIDEMGRLAPTVKDYYNKEHNLDDIIRGTTYTYMKDYLAPVSASDAKAGKARFLGAWSPLGDFHKLTEFFIANSKDWVNEVELCNEAIKTNHSIEAYLLLLRLQNVAN